MGCSVYSSKYGMYSRNKMGLIKENIPANLHRDQFVRVVLIDFAIMAVVKLLHITIVTIVGLGVVGDI